VTRIETADRSFSLDDIAPLGRLGVLALATDYNIEHDLRRMLPPGLEMFTNRIANANPMTLENLRTMASDISRAAAGILPGRGVDAMIYACTSGTAAIGADRITERIRAVWPGIPVTNPLDAAVAAINAFGAKRISVLTPYIEEINREVAVQFCTRGIEVLNIRGFGFDDDIEATGIPPSRLVEAALQTCDPAADLVFISCTALRAAGVIAQIEQALGKPALSSNQVLAWHAMRLMGCSKQVMGFASLFEKFCAPG
jgi:maleate isomerase